MAWAHTYQGRGCDPDALFLPCLGTEPTPHWSWKEKDTAQGPTQTKSSQKHTAESKGDRLTE